MKISIRTLGVLAGVFAFCAVIGTAQAADRPYTEGTVSVVSSVRTLPGQYDNYMKYLATTYKALMEEQKALGNILGWRVYTAMPRTPEDPNLILVVTYKNFAALDGLMDKTDAAMAKVIGDQAARDNAMVARNNMRTQVGSEMIREVVFK